MVIILSPHDEMCLFYSIKRIRAHTNQSSHDHSPDVNKKSKKAQEINVKPNHAYDVPSWATKCEQITDICEAIYEQPV